MQKQAKFYSSGGMLMPAARVGTGFKAKNVSGGALTQGTVVQYGSSTSEPNLDETVAAGDGTPPLTFELPNTSATFDIGSINFVYNEAASLADNDDGLFVESGYMVKARVTVPTGGFRAGSPLMIDYAGTPGVLIEAVGGAGNIQKVVAYTAVEQANAGAPAEFLMWVYFGQL